MTVEIPALSTIFASSSQTATDMFDFGWPYMLIGMGITVGVYILLWLVHTITGFFGFLFGGQNGTGIYRDVTGTRYWNKKDRDDMDKYIN